MDWNGLFTAFRRILRGAPARWMSVALLGIVGAWIAILVAGRVHTSVGPFRTTFWVSPTINGQTHVELAPLGALSMRTHKGPARLDVQLDRLQLPQAQQLLKDPNAVNKLEIDVERDAKSGVTKVVWRSLLLALVGGAVFGLLRRPHWLSAVVGSVAAVVFIAGSFGVAAATFRPAALSEPSYTGLLTLAPQAIGNFKEATSKFSVYRQELNDMVSNVTRLYDTVQATSPPGVDTNTIRILHISDLHLNPAGFDLAAQMIRQFHPDAVIDTGDINDWGTTFESAFVQRISTLGLPYVFVRGNHDSLATQAAVATQPNAIVLDGTAATVAGLRVWGIGDPRFTADKTLYDNKEQERQTAQQFAPVALAKLREAQTSRVDVALVHDPATASQLDDSGVPLVLAGHLHRSEQSQLGPKTMLLVEGSTGAAGLRGVAESGTSVPLECSILYFDKATHRLRAYDEVKVQGLGGSGAQIDRHVLATTQPDKVATG